MNTLRKNLEQREKPELIAIITHMLRQEPDLQWLLTTPLPTSSPRKASIDPKMYRQQVQAAMSVGENQRQRKRHEVQRKLDAGLFGLTRDRCSSVGGVLGHGIRRLSRRPSAL